MLPDTKIYQYDRRTLEADALDLSCLSQDEQERAAKFVFPEDEQWFRLSRAKLRTILAAELGQTASTLQFTYNAAGKPTVSGIQFNISHSKQRLMIATHPINEIGVDIECYEDQDHSAIMQRFFHQDEIDLYLTLPVTMQQQAFYHLWVIKESIAKALGISLYKVLDDVAITGFVDGKNIKIKGELGKRLQVSLLPFTDNHYAAIAEITHYRD